MMELVWILTGALVGGLIVGLYLRGQLVAAQERIARGDEL